MADVPKGVLSIAFPRAGSQNKLLISFVYLASHGQTNTSQQDIISLSAEISLTYNIALFYFFTNLL
jgi:hypothetical protein